MVQLHDLMRTGQVPTDWRKTSFKMLPKTMRAKIPSAYRPIATIRLFYIFFAYMILGRVNWKRISQKNNMVFGVADVWKNIL